MSVSAIELAQRAGTTHRSLNYWVIRGYLKPDGDVRGTGNHHYFSGAEVRVAYDMAALVNAGVKPEYAAKIARGNCQEYRALHAALRELGWARMST